MTHDVAETVPPGAGPARRASASRRRAPLPVTSSPSSPGPASTGRLVGLDLARGLAVLGMFAVHVGPDPTVGGPLGWLMEVARGRSSALFALLAGFTLILLTGRPRPRTGRAGREAVVRVLIRSVVLIALGYALTGLGTGIDVILPAYGVIFALALPLRRLRAASLAAVAGATALVLPQVLYPLQGAVQDGGWADTVVAHDPLARITGSGGVLELLVTGAYPVLTWLPFVVAGMALARLDLTRPGVRARIALWGAALAVLGYGGSWLALHLVTGARAAVSAATGGGPAASAWWSDAVGDPTSRTPDWLLVAAPHSQTTGSILGNTGVGLVIVACCLLATERSARFRRLATPVVAVGSISLTTYVCHIVAIKVLGFGDLPDSAALPALVAFVAAAVLLAVVWTRAFGRGPLERLLRLVTLPARLIGRPAKGPNPAPAARPPGRRHGPRPAHDLRRPRRATEEVRRCRSA
ncbi:DUF418 domain-containing protein [Streptomyces sp. NPDC001083]|uniref:DUF418 domain-containing protein n=1 Tax=Streptomyces sp. NPDC001083 TaxID=3364545 RepID=UPI0036AF5CF9